MDFGLGLVSGAHAGAVVPVGRMVRVGSAAGLDVCLSEVGVDPRHAQLVQHGEGYRLMDLHSQGGTFVDGERVPPGEQVPVAAGSLLRFGQGGPLALLDRLERLRQVPQDLAVARDDGPGGAWSLTQGLQVGRGEHCEVQLDPEHDALASSTHLHLLPAFGGAVATDLGSANGTWAEQDGRRVFQRFLRPGEAVLLGGASGPRLRLRFGLVPPRAPSLARASGSRLSLAARATVPSVPECFWIEVTAGGSQGRIRVACRTEARFGSFAGLNDFETTCFARDLESEADALERAEPIGPQHGTFALTRAGVVLRDAGFGRTKVDGVWLPPRGEAPLGEEFAVWLGEDSLGLRGRVLRHPRLGPAAPAVGVEGRHPVECVPIERMGDGDDSRLYLLLVRQATIGAADDAAVRVPAPGVADQHAALYLRAGGLWISQLGPDPVAVDGAPLTPGNMVPLGIGSSFFIGTARFRISEG